MQPHRGAGRGKHAAAASARVKLLVSVAAALATAVAAACGGVSTGGLASVTDAGVADATTAGSSCIPGAQVACACVGGATTGVQTCNRDGTGYDPCVGCPSADGGPAVAELDAADDRARETGVGAGAEGGCGSLTTVENCGACGRACDTTTGSPSCNATTCGYACNTGRSDCDLHAAPDTDGCECATPGCCGDACQTTHSTGTGAHFYDCTDAGTHDSVQAKAACAAFTGDAGACKSSSACCDDSLGLCITVQSTEAICGSAAGTCHCWSFVGDDSGTVQTPDASCAEICPSAGDPAWN